MSLGTDILQLLAERPGLDVDEIGAHVGHPVEEVRRCLGNTLRPFVSRDWNQRWFLDEQLPARVKVGLTPDTLRALLGTTREAPGSAGSDLDVGASPTARLARWLRDAHRWAIAEGYEPALGALLSIDGELLPPDLAARREALFSLASTDASPEPSEPFSPVLEWFLSLDERRQEILSRRTLAFGRRAILESLAEEFGVTRERVRQLEQGLTDDLARWAHSWGWQAVRWRAHSLARVAGLTAPEGHHELRSLFADLHAPTNDADAVVRSVHWRLAGPYSRADDGWLVRSEDELEGLRAQLASAAGEHGFLTYDEAQGIGAAAGVRPYFFKEWLAKEPRFRMLSDRVVSWSPFLGDRLTVVLRLSGVPQTVDQLHALVGPDIDVRSLRSRLSGDDRFTRAGLTEWALAEWGLPEYNGIAEAISALLETSGDEERVDDVVAQLSTQFGLAESSVRALCGAPRFVQRNGKVRLRRPDEPYPVSGELWRTPNVFRTGLQQACVVVPVDSQTLKGSGRSLPEPLAGILDLAPGDDCSFGSVAGPIRVSWPDTSITGPAIGSLRVPAEMLGATQGDLLRVLLDGEAGTAQVDLILQHQLAEADAVGRVRLLTGLDMTEGLPAVRDTLARAVGTSPAELRRALEKRGDEWLLPVLPEERPSIGLTAAIDQLAELLVDCNR